MNPMNLSPQSLHLLKQLEGCRLERYLDAAGVPTIGYGTTGANLPETITQDEADALLLKRLRWFEKVVNHVVTAPITQNQYDALVLLCYNIGDHAFATSTLLRNLNQGDYKGAAAEFKRWSKAGGKTCAGLISRRKTEQALFLSTK